MATTYYISYIYDVDMLQANMIYESITSLPYTIHIKMSSLLIATVLDFSYPDVIVTASSGITWSFTSVRHMGLKMLKLLL